ncbi:hypothetical protein HII31_12437 [Pseudocercospora fuligena]|uniref:Uncharacterized protein n=1 Tax=Pseudocercospora fuligena TaxID=685502 RepID=A0A8H6R6J4_9PEZI|nr:hypothetical protein HII31_12437 [Pseudocercospora fuligena]
MKDHHHKQYRGQAFQKDEKGNHVKIAVNGRIIVDSHLFRLMNPNYNRVQVSSISWDSFMEMTTSKDYKEQPEFSSVDVADVELGADEFVICSPTVRGFSLADNLWLESAVANIAEIQWMPSSFDNLTLPPGQKRVVHALCHAHLIRACDQAFDDFIIGKGRGLVILLL